MSCRGSYRWLFCTSGIQVSFGWLNYHLYNFVDAKGTVYESDADAMDLPLDKGQKMLLAAEVAIGKVLKKVGDKIDYMYDFGDGNEIEIRTLGAVSGFVSPTLLPSDPISSRTPPRSASHRAS